MTDIVTFFVPGPPGAKHRPRFTRKPIKLPNGKLKFSYPHPEDVEAERTIGQIAKQAMAGRKPFEGAIDLRIYITYLQPRSWSKKKQDNTVWKISKPDLDNTTKRLKDSLNKIAWFDDSQVAQMFVHKKYGDEEGVLVTISPL